MMAVPLDPPAGSRADSTSTAALDLRVLNAGACDEVTPAAHATWVGRVAAGGLACAGCRRTLAFGGVRQPLLIGAVKFGFEHPTLAITAFCLACCLEHDGPERAGDALAATTHGLREPDRRCSLIFFWSTRDDDP
jgi:hypothetical protein